MNKMGKIFDIKKTKNNIFIKLNDQFEQVIQLVIKPEYFKFDDINVGDVIDCDVEIDYNNNSKYKCEYPSFIVRNMDVVSHHIENIKFNPNISGIQKYSLVKSKTREYLNSLGYIEVTLPTLTDDSVSSKSRSFCTEHYYSEKQLYLRKTMDPFLRILSCSGMNKIYSIGDIYRNEHVTAFRQPVSEMLSIFTTYANKKEMIQICLELLDKLDYLKNKEIEYLDYVNTIIDYNDKIQIISGYPISNESNAKIDKNNGISNEFKIKFNDKTIVHGVDEICDIEEYLNMLSNQDKKISKGDLEVLRNCIASGALPCYNLGISLQRIVMLFDNLSLKDINPFTFDRFKVKEKKK